MHVLLGLTILTALCTVDALPLAENSTILDTGNTSVNTADAVDLDQLNGTTPNTISCSQINVVDSANVNVTAAPVALKVKRSLEVQDLNATAENAILINVSRASDGESSNLTLSAQLFPKPSVEMTNETSDASFTMEREALIPKSNSSLSSEDASWNATTLAPVAQAARQARSIDVQDANSTASSVQLNQTVTEGINVAGSSVVVRKERSLEVNNLNASTTINPAIGNMSGVIETNVFNSTIATTELGEVKMTTGVDNVLGSTVSPVGAESVSSETAMRPAEAANWTTVTPSSQHFNF